jgi:uncharacterized membrane protein AbrB (regulator of aidB expression)
VLLVCSALVSLVWGKAGLPAGLMLGPMIAGILFGVQGMRLSVPRWPYIGARAVAPSITRLVRRYGSLERFDGCRVE